MALRNFPALLTLLSMGVASCSSDPTPSDDGNPAAPLDSSTSSGAMAASNPAPGNNSATAANAMSPDDGSVQGMLDMMDQPTADDSLDPTDNQGLDGEASEPSAPVTGADDPAPTDDAPPQQADANGEPSANVEPNAEQGDVPADTPDAPQDPPPPDGSEIPEPNTDCSFEIDASLSPAIGTVGVVSFTTDLGSVDRGYIEFGPDESYGLRAPLETAEANNSTLLLGMTPATDYHYRIVAQSGTSVCASQDAIITTNAAPSGVPTPNVNVSDASLVAPGFIITSAGGGAGGGGGPYILIYDHTGQLVWWHQASIGGITRSRISWDGKWIYGRDGNPGAGNGGSAMRVSIDGQTEEVLDVATGHHDMTVTPNNSVLFLTGGGADGCSRIHELSADGELTLYYDLRDAFGDGFQAGAADACHCNSIHYNTDDSSISVSCLSQNAFVKISDAGEPIWVLGGNANQSQFTGDIEWSRQHGHHMVTPQRILFFNNNGSGGGGGGLGGGGPSLAVELELDTEQMTATRVWEYDGGHSSQTFGDAQLLPNGNRLITYSNEGVMHEVDEAKTLIQEWTFPSGTGYADHRPTLYGPPPRP